MQAIGYFNSLQEASLKAISSVTDEEKATKVKALGFESIHTVINLDELGSVVHSGYDIFHEIAPDLAKRIVKDIFKQKNVPSDIDYMSLDVEGSEIQALEGFPFDTHICKIITVEHNLYLEGPENKMKIKEILEKNGYVCVRDNVAYTKHGLNNPYEDWYTHQTYYNTYLTYNK
jgi:hypothetical protein